MPFPVADIISLTAILCYIITIGMLLYSHQIIYLIIIAGLLMNQIVNYILKSILGTKYSFTKRPNGAKNCNMLNGGGDARLIPGFPSGHVSLVACFVTLLHLYLGFPAIYGLLWVLVMMWSRIARKCHTLLQTFAGAISGFLVGYIWFKIFS